MPCNAVQIPGGGVVIVCMRGRRARLRRCVVCHIPETWTEIRLCDGPARRGKGTCDAPICIEHAVHVDPALDYCPRCAPPVPPEVPHA